MTTPLSHHSSNWQFLFQDPASPVMEGIVRFHHDLMFLLIFIVFFVLYMLVEILTKFQHLPAETPLNRTSHNTVLEIFWTVVPSIILIFVAVPSFALLYSIDELVTTSLTLRVVGHQWYWSYEYSDYLLPDSYHKELDSYMLADEDLVPGNLRLLDTTTVIRLPVGLHIRLLITSADVLHSWAIPSLGIKMDACPGRINQAAMFIKNTGLYYGQCSEICGVNHGFMPIRIDAVTLDDYQTWFEVDNAAPVAAKISPPLSWSEWCWSWFGY